ncbi:MAG: glycosyltransferase family 2 protein [Chloroflexota bacterium]
MAEADASVVIPNWNGREYLGECLASVISPDGSGRALEVIVVDNGSTDGSADLVRSTFPRVRLLANDANRGFAAACNQGARAAAAEHVAFLNNDARVDPGWLAPLLDALVREPDVAAVGSLVLDWEGTSIDFGRSGLTPMARGVQLDYGQPLADAPTQPTEQLFANGAAMMVRRDLFLEVGGFDERFFAYYEDVDLGWRYWIMGWRVLLEPASRVFHRHHGTSRRLRREQIDFLLTRNAISSAIKNAEDETLRRLLPVLLLEASAQMANNLGSPDRFHVPGFDAFAYRKPPTRSRATDAWHRLGSEAVRLYRRDSAIRSRLARLVAGVIDPGGILVDSRTGAAAAALDDILWGWSELLASRATIQAKRKRSDREVSQLFGLEIQRRVRRSDAITPDLSREAVFRALEGAGLEWLLPRG